MIEDLESRFVALERRMQRQEDYRAVCNLMGRYQYLMTGGQNGVIGRELYAWDAPDAHCEYGPLGVFYGKKGVEFFDQVDINFCHGRLDGTDDGTLEYHQITTPVIEIAEDGETAKGMWLSTGVMMMAKDPDTENGSFLWDSGKYAVDFLKWKGEWKIWHLHVLDMWRSDFDRDPVLHREKAQSWTTQAMIDDYRAREAAGESVRPMGFPVPDAPTTFHYFYADDLPAPRLPPAPQPYRTFSETFSY